MKRFGRKGGQARGVLLLLGLIFVTGYAWSCAAAETAPDSQIPPQTSVAERIVEGTILKIDGQTLTVAVPQEVKTNGETLTIAVPQEFKVIGDDAQQKLGTLSQGDRVRLTEKGNVAQAKDVLKDNPTVPVSVQGRLVAGFLAFVLVFFVAGLATGKSNNGKLEFGNPLSFCVGVDNRTSNSQTQMVFWSATVLVAYLTTVFLRGWITGWDLLGGVSIPANLLAFSGLSALSFGGARAITVSKINAAGAAGATAATDAPAAAEDATNDAQVKADAAASAVEAAQAAPDNSGTAAAGAAIDAAEEAARKADVAQAAAQQAKAPDTDGSADIKQAPAGTAHITQLFQNDFGRADLGDTQMILITMIAIATYLATSFHQLGNLEIAPNVSLPDIDTYLLASFGIGQGAYLAKKAASNLGSG
jgi:hypothetical protein